MSEDSQTPRVMVCKIGLDGHDRGAKVVVRALREAGIEVISAEDVARLAREERVDVVGVSTLSGAHEAIFRRLLQALRTEGLDQVTVVAGGIIPERDRKALQKAGVARIWGPGTHTGEIVTFIKDRCASAPVEIPGI